MCLGASGSHDQSIKIGIYGENECPYGKAKDWPEVTLRWPPARQGEPSKLELKEVVIKARSGLFWEDILEEEVASWVVGWV